MSIVVLLLGMVAHTGIAPAPPDTAAATFRAIIQPGAVVAPLPRLELAATVRPPAQDRWLGEDKLRHFFLSHAAASLAHGVARTAGLEEGPALSVAGALALGAGVWKELRDRGRQGETASFKDLVWDALGVAAALSLAAGT